MRAKSPRSHYRWSVPKGKPARKSRMLRLSRYLMIAGSLLGLIPELVTDPAFSVAVSEALPPTARLTFAAIVAGIGFYVRKLRLDTTQPIDRG